MLNAANKVKLKKIAIVGITSVIATSAVATIIHASSLDIEKKKSQEKAIEQKIKLEMLEEERIRDEAVSNKMEEQKDAMRYFKDREQPASKTDRVEVETNTDSFVDERTSNEQDLIDKLNLNYNSSRRSRNKLEEIRHKMIDIHVKLDTEHSMDNLYPMRPKGMHHETYHNLIDELQHLERCFNIMMNEIFFRKGTYKDITTNEFIEHMR